MSVIFLREEEIAFSAEERGSLKHLYGKHYNIPVIPHTPWKQKPAPSPKLILSQFIELVRESIRTCLYEHFTSSYISPVFCVKNSNGTCRIVPDLQDLNKLIIKDEGLQLHMEEFVDVFSKRDCYGLGDIMGGYDEREFEISTRPLTTFGTPLGRIKLTILPQGATNYAEVYQDQITWIIKEEIPENIAILIYDRGTEGSS
ncbi:hypothetical protein O181_024678 [Austropuccinia psidii MF-1]|uniref:Uncharacterized protein n=1 Tax=Austropuccinia psidii MF-1 TaxID=1389203 RepID=A0A9Q3CL80_9BASI|nr:hypothetical protein [Austropuccinia psidii MF-1]